MTKVLSSGPMDARIMIIGEAPGATEEAYGMPFCGQSGQELDQMLQEVGIFRAECFVTNVVRYRPPKNDIEQWIPTKKKDALENFVEATPLNGSEIRRVDPRVAEGISELEREILAVRPRFIIALGNTALWALTGNQGITRWRGSQLWYYPKGAERIPLIPTYHPALILRQWEWRSIAMIDLRRAKSHLDGKLPWERSTRFYRVRPNFSETCGWLTKLITQAEKSAELPLHLSVDIETRFGQIACIGIAWSSSEAICIPFRCIERPDGYWDSVDKELVIVDLLRRLLTHLHVRVIGQNFLYDTQYLAQWWGFIPRLDHDTMIAQSVLFSGLPKALYFLASMYCSYYQYWKDDGKEWNRNMDEEQLWRYNCDDCCYTWEIAESQRASIKRANLFEPFKFQMRLAGHAIRAMMRGIRINDELKAELSQELADTAGQLDQFFQEVLGHPLNPKSPKQLQALFYVDFAMKPIKNRKTHQVTTDDDALQKIGLREPLLRPIVNAIADARSVGVFKSTFVDAKVSSDGRIRCSFNPAGTITYRLSSSQDAWDSGMNLQNIPTEGSKSANKAVLRKSDIKLPDVRKMFVPDEGKVFWNGDLDRADLQVVVWEADDEVLKQALQEGIDLHLLNARDLFDLPYHMDDLRDPSLLGRIRNTYKPQREFCKTFVHGTNYGGSAKTMAENSRCSVSESETFQRRWFQAHPGIKEWHIRTEVQLQTEREVRNKFGYRIYFFDRVEGLLPEALAWVPQSTVACVINRGWDRINRELSFSQAEVLLQVHDSLAGQKDPLLPIEKIRDRMLIEIPYPDPLTIPVTIKLSEKSWGHCA